MRSRKTTIKKPKFLLPYFISAFLFLILAFGAAVIICMPWFFEYEYDLKTAANEKLNNVIEYLKEALDKRELTPSDIAAAKEALISHYDETGQRCEVVISGNTQSPVKIDSTRTAILDYTRRSEDGNYSFYCLQLADNKYLKYFDSPEVNAYKTAAREDAVMDYFERTDDDLSYIRFKCREFYADFDKGVFIPVEAEICTYTDGQGDITLSGVIVRCEPDNTEGYTLIKTQDGVSLCIGIIAGYTGTDNDSDYTGFSTSENGLVTRREWTPLVQIPFTKKFSKGIMMGVAAIILAAVVFAFIPATIRYNTKKRRYEVFEYRSQMVDAMAHDLKTPMAAVSAYAENLSNHIGTDKQEYYAGKVEEKVAQMNKMVNDMLEFSKSEKQTAAIAKEDVDISDVISKVIADNEHMIGERSLKISYDRKSITVKTDESLFRQAIANLINNAVIYSKEGSTIVISCDSRLLTISNTSDGEIDTSRDLKQPFAKGSSARGNHGTGLGLAIANNNLAMLGYKLEIRISEDRFIAEVKL
jgi:signal transduction histidine kinase